ncbi:hypothetical protein CLOP_g1142 [Closterium sp. NIES-67]|nr:hypothetical protein CLOP_g1142 [Closterium sp. NIES-67]
MTTEEVKAHEGDGADAAAASPPAAAPPSDDVAPADAAAPAPADTAAADGETTKADGEPAKADGETSKAEPEAVTTPAKDAKDAKTDEKPAGEEGTSHRRRKRKSLWDTEGPDGKKLESPAVLASPSAAGILPGAVSPAISGIPGLPLGAGMLPGAAAAMMMPGAAMAQQAQLLQQQQLLQMRALAQAKMAEAAAVQQQQSTVTQSNAQCRIYVGSIFYDLTEADILLAFSPFGPITKIDMPKDASTGKHKGFCFIEFTTPETASTAIAAMNDFTLAGRPP